MLEDTDQLLSDAIRDLKLRGDLFGNLLGVNGYMMWLAAIRNALSGHAAAVFPLLRIALESICYWAKIESDASLATIWLERHKDDERRKKARDAFTPAVKDVAAMLGTSPREALGAHIIELYDSLIDFGAHPNPRGLFEGVSVGDAGANKVLNFTALESPDAHAVRRAMIACVECGAYMVALVSCPPITKKEADACDLSAVVAIFERTNTYTAKSSSQFKQLQAAAKES
jgi:hypothetical protein